LSSSSIWRCSSTSRRGSAPSRRSSVPPGQLAPGTLIPWRAHIRQAFVAELCQFPLRFPEFAIQGSILAEAYRRLLALPAAQLQAGQP
jgi:hypothetical protein